jgi:hypothetical protein
MKKIIIENLIVAATFLSEGNVTVKQCHYRPGQALRVPRG